MAGNIIGTQNPTVGTTAYYEVSIFSILGSFSAQYEWHLFKKQKNNTWKDITGTPKTGKRVPYTFGEIAVGVEFEIKVYEIPQSILSGVNPSKKLLGTLVLFPTSSKVSKIEKVVLFNRGAKDSNKVGYRDTLIAQAHCIALFNQEIEFHLWEDDAPGKGHNATINKNNRHTRVYKAVVNEKGIAEVKIPLSTDERILRQMANQYLMRGDKNEGANHEYYVTASYAGKIQGASQVNVSVANPDYKSSPPASTPKKDSPKFPTGQGGKKQPDPKGNIVDAVFIDDQGKELSKVTVGNRVRVRIHSKNLVGKHIQYVVWEYDAGSNDEIYRSESIKITADLYDSSGFIITKGIFDKGTDLPFGDPDADSQHYFIEIITLDIGAESVKFGVHSEGLMEVENVKSPAVVKATPKPPNNTSCICKEQYKDLVWGEKIGCKERRKVIEVAQNIGVDPNWLMTVIALETIETFSTSIDNGIGYVGLIQFGENAAKDVGTTQDKLVKMSFVEQMNYVQKHLNKNKSKYKTLTDLYLAVLYPSASGHGSEKNYVVLDGRAYLSNPLFYREKGEWEYATKVNRNGKKIKYKKATDPNGKTYVWEITEVAQEVYNKGLEKKAKEFTCGLNKENSIKTGDCIDTWDSVTNKKIEKLHPKIRCSVKNFINEVEKTMGIKLRVIQGFRTYAEQDALYAQGRTTGGSKVTNAKGGQSNHNFGLAIDVAEIKNGKIDWNEQEKVLPKVAPIGKKWGFEWGGDWKSLKDKPHFEMMFGKSLSELRKLYNENGKDHTKISL
jgi:hypothetical protein